MHFAGEASGEVYIRINQVGYLPEDPKVAIVMSSEDIIGCFWTIENKNGNTEMSGFLGDDMGVWLNDFHHYKIDFSNLRKSGEYRIKLQDSTSPKIIVDKNIYRDILEAAIDFYQFQRCGWDREGYGLPCHLLDATEIIGGPLDRERIDADGGWHDAADYVKFTLTTANTIYLMMLTCQVHHIPEEVKMKILDEAKVGLNWLQKMYYAPGELLLQVSDLRDHTANWRLPENDQMVRDRPAHYGPSKAVLGSVSSAFAISAQVFHKYDTEISETYKSLAISAYNSSRRVNVLTSSGPDSMYYDNTEWDNLALAAVEIFQLTGVESYLKDSQEHLRGNRVAWVSWGDVGMIAALRLAKYDKKYAAIAKELLEYFDSIARSNPFGFPLEEFPWGTTSVQAGLGSIAFMYELSTKSEQFLSFAYQQRDFILGLNPYGISFVIGFGKAFPKHPHHQISFLTGKELTGALMEGLVDRKLYESKDIELEKEDLFIRFQSENVVYYDERLNYLTNEPSIFANALLILLLSKFVR